MKSVAIKVALMAILVCPSLALAGANCPCSAACVCGCNDGKPCTCGNAATPKSNTPFPVAGIDFTKISSKQRILHGGKEITKDKALQLIEDVGKDVPDDRALMRLTVIGDETTRKQVLDDLNANPALAAFKNQLVVQSYAPDHWAVARSGFKTQGNPVIYVQDFSGKVLHRQEEYRGAEKLAEAIRKADPTYDASKDPDKNKSGFAGIDLSQVPQWAWAVGAVAVYLLFFRKESK